MAEKESVGDGLGISGFTLGVLSIIFAGWMGIIISVVGGIFCFVQQKNKKMRIAKVGLILNIVGFVVSILFVFLYSLLIAPLLEGLV
jgi:glucose uptake protein GlcU